MKQWLITISGLGALAIASSFVYVAVISPLVLLSFRVALIVATAGLAVAVVLALVLAGYYILFKVQGWGVALDTARGKAVQFHSAGGQTYAANPAGVPIQPLHLNASRFGRNEDEDQIDLLKWAAFYGGRQSPKVIGALAESPALLPTPRLMPVLPMIINDQRLLINGGMGSGKTNLLRWIAYEKARMSKVLVIDTHAAPGLWPIDQQAVLGRGRNWPAVELALQNLLGIMDRRYKDIDAGTVGYRGHEIITVIADEWTMIPQMIGADIIKAYSKPVLIESRKVGIDFILATHDTTVESLGTRGMGGLIRAFDWIVETQKRDGQYICKLRKPGQKLSEAVEYAAPPLFAGTDTLERPIEPSWIAAMKSVNIPQAYEPDDGELTDDAPTDEEQAIMVAYYQVRDESDGGKIVLKQVCEKLGWKPGGMQYDKIRAAMRRWTTDSEL